MELQGTVVKGHQVASGSNQNPLFPGGTLAMQLPFFKALGLDLTDWHLATLNASISPRDFKITNPNWHFKNVAWHPSEPAEDFSFVQISVASVAGLIYFPHPQTKPAHHQPAGMMEIILKTFLPDIQYGSVVLLDIPENRVKIITPEL